VTKFAIPVKSVKSTDVEIIAPQPPAMMMAPAVEAFNAAGLITQEFAALAVVAVTSSGVVASTPRHT
jgi:hypothetical protein